MLVKVLLQVLKEAYIKVTTLIKQHKKYKQIHNIKITTQLQYKDSVVKQNYIFKLCYVYYVNM